MRRVLPGVGAATLSPQRVGVDPEARTDAEHEALISDSVGLALMVVLDTLSPSERLAFVLRDVFGMPFDEINGAAGMVAWTPKSEPFAVGSFTVRDGRIVSMEFLSDPQRIRQLDLAFLEPDVPPS